MPLPRETPDRGAPPTSHTRPRNPRSRGSFSNRQALAHLTAAAWTVTGPGSGSTSCCPQLDTSPTCSGSSFPRPKQCCWRRRRTSPRSRTSRPGTGRRSGRRTPWNRSTARSSAALTSSRVFPDDDALLLLVTAVLVEMHDEWIAFLASTSPKAAWTSSTPSPRMRPRATQHNEQAAS